MRATIVAVLPAARGSRRSQPSSGPRPSGGGSVNWGAASGAGRSQPRGHYVWANNTRNSGERILKEEVGAWSAAVRGKRH